MSLNSKGATVSHSGNVVDLFADGGIYRVTICGDSGSESCMKFWLKVEDYYSQGIFSMLLTAKTAGNGVWVQGGDGQPETWPYYGANRLNALHLKP